MGKSQLSFSSDRSSHRRRQKIANAIVGMSIFLLLLGAVLATKPGGRLLTRWVWQFPFQKVEVLPLDPQLSQIINQPPQERIANLQQLAQGEKSLRRDRARYLLATDLIELGRAQEALEWLEKLEYQYPALAGYVVLRRAQAYEKIGDTEKALQTWQNLLEVYTAEPVAAHALYTLLSKESPYRQNTTTQLPDHPTFFDRVENAYTFSADDPRYWRTALEEYPAHPLVIKLVKERLEDNPNDPDLMLHLAHHAFDDPDIIPVLDRLVSFYRPAIGQEEYATIQQEDWKYIAQGYWLDRKYSQASAAYNNAEKTPKHTYLAALGLQYARQQNQAERAYKALLEEFPDSEESAQALLRLAELQPDLEAVPYLDRVVADYPDHAGEALLAKANVLKSLDSQAGANQTLEELITTYNKNDAAAQYRWQVAQTQAEAGNLRAALNWVEPIRQSNLDSEIARRAIFWEGKWAKELGETQQAITAFETVLQNYPWSYYAWRSAVHLGKDVGDFDSLRPLTPKLQLPQTRPILPAGSPALKELYQIGEDQQAWMLWQAEFQNPLEPTLDEQYTDGLLHNAVGNYLKGISLLWELEDQDTEAEQAKYRQIQQQSEYWQGIYPFPYSDLVLTAAEKQELNPLLPISVMRQESRFDPDIESSAEALGLMQIIPSTADWAARNLDMADYDLTKPEDNVTLGTWYLRRLHRAYEDNSLLAIASYNAGQGNVNSWLAENPNLDHDQFVEAIPFNETRDYVKQVFGNYWNYLQLYDPQIKTQLNQGKSNP
jgi:soluble lytic murein transglycosylase